MNKKSQIDSKVVIAGIAGLVIIECFALSQGINGILMGIVVAAIAGAIGVAIPKEKILK